MSKCAQAGKVPENHHRPCPGILIPKIELGAQFEMYLLTCVIKMASTSPIVHSLSAECATNLYQISFFSPSHPSLKHLSLTPNSWASLTGVRIQLRSFFHGQRRPVLVSVPSSRYCGRHGMHSSVCPPFHENSPGPGQGQIFKQGAEVQFLVTARTVYLHL